MFSICEEVDGAYYVELVLSQEDLKEITNKNMVECLLDLKGRRYYLAVRLKCRWDDDDENEED